MKKVVALVLAAAMTAGLFAGCASGSDSAKTATNDSQKSTEVSKPVEPVNLKFMHWWSYVDDNLIQDFTKDNPNVKIEMDYTAIDSYPDKIKLLSTSNDLPDIFAGQGEYMKEFIKQGLVTNLNEVMKSKAYDKDVAFGDTITESLMKRMWDGNPEPYTGKQETFAVPFGAVAVSVVYNKNIFEKVGIKPPKTWDEMLSNCEALKKAGYIPMSFTGKVWGSWWLSFMFDQYNRDDRNIKDIEADFLNGKKKFTDENFVKGFATLESFAQKGYWDPGMFSSGIEESQALFVQQKMAQFLVVPENFVTYLIDNMPDGVQLDAFPLPPMKEGMQARTVGGTSNALLIKKDASNAEAAANFLKYMVSQSTFNKLAKVNIVPSTKGYVPPENSPIMKAYADAIQNGFVNYGLPPVTPEFDSYLWEELFIKVLTTDMTAEDAMKLAQKEYEKMPKNKN